MYVEYHELKIVKMRVAKDRIKVTLTIVNVRFDLIKFYELLMDNLTAKMYLVPI